MKLVNDLMIKKHEVFAEGGEFPPNLRAYMPTPNDVPTIGWGHTKGVKMGDVITEKKAQEFFEADTKWAVNAVNTKVKVGLTQNQFDALVSFVFNIGETNFGKSTLLRKLNAGDYQGAAEQFPRWNKQKGKVLRGLTRRRAQEMELFLSEGKTLVDAPSRKVADTKESLPSLVKSKEMVAGSTAILAGVGGVVASLSPISQTILISGLTFLMVAVGVMIVWNRINSRKNGDR